MTCLLPLPMRPTPDDRIGQIINMDLNFHHSFVKFDEHQNAKIVSDAKKVKVGVFTVTITTSTPEAETTKILWNINIFHYD